MQKHESAQNEPEKRDISLKVSGMLMLGAGLAFFGLAFGIIHAGLHKPDSVAMYMLVAVLALSVLSSMVFLAGGTLHLISCKYPAFLILGFLPVLLGSMYGTRFLWSIHIEPLGFAHWFGSFSTMLLGSLLWRRACVLKKITTRN